MSDFFPDDPTAFLAKLEELCRRSDQIVADMHAGIAHRKKEAARARAEQRVREAEELEAEARELEEEAARLDVRDMPELQNWADQFGYRQGYSGRPVRFSPFHQAMRKEWAEDYRNLDPRYYESYYVGGHMRGESAAVTLAAYAMDHGEARPPNPLVVWGE